MSKTATRAFDATVSERGVFMNPAALNKAQVTLTAGQRDLSPMIMERTGRLRIMPAEFYRGTSQEERSIVCHRNALYCLPTVELIDWLRAFIGTRRAMEIGAGNGAISAALRIRATDNRMQEHPDIAAQYASMGVPTVVYGRQVERLPANEAVRRYRPAVVIAAWVTHKFDPAQPEREGNSFGVDEADIIANCEAYVFIGNHGPHAKKPIWTLPHEIIEPDWLFSRSHSGLRDFISIWRRAPAT